MLVGFRKGFQGNPEKSELVGRSPLWGSRRCCVSSQTEIPISTQKLKEVLLKSTRKLKMVPQRRLGFRRDIGNGCYMLQPPLPPPKKTYTDTIQPIIRPVGPL